MQNNLHLILKLFKGFSIKHGKVELLIHKKYFFEIRHYLILGQRTGITPPRRRVKN